MDFYVLYFEKEIRQAEDNPTIGLILCAQKNEAMAKYTLLENSKTVFASKYKLYLPTEKELRTELQREKRQLELEMKASQFPSIKICPVRLYGRGKGCVPPL